jgi:hypothetical protein
MMICRFTCAARCTLLPSTRLTKFGEKAVRRWRGTEINTDGVQDALVEAEDQRDPGIGVGSMTAK